MLIQKNAMHSSQARFSPIRKGKSPSPAKYNSSKQTPNKATRKSAEKSTPKYEYLSKVDWKYKT